MLFPYQFQIKLIGTSEPEMLVPLPESSKYSRPLHIVLSEDHCMIFGSTGHGRKTMDPLLRRHRTMPSGSSFIEILITYYAYQNCTEVQVTTGKYNYVCSNFLFILVGSHLNLFFCLAASHASTLYFFFPFS